MMDCEQARQLFDAYLNGELSASLATELGAHRLRCAECRRAMALLEVSGHIIGSDRDPVALREGFSERLLACMEPRPARWIRRWRRQLYVAGPLAAAAVVAMAFLGVFDRRDSVVAGAKVRKTDAARNRPLPADSDEEYGTRRAEDATAHSLDDWAQRAERIIEAKRKSGASLEQALNESLARFLDVLKQAEDQTVRKEEPADAAAPRPPATSDADPAERDPVGDP